MQHCRRPVVERPVARLAGAERVHRALAVGGEKGRRPDREQRQSPVDQDHPGLAPRRRQDEAVKLLDQLIKKAQDKEKKQGGSGRRGGKGQGQGRGDPNSPANDPRRDSEAPAGAGRIGDLRPTEKVDPGEMWGKLPPAEREKLLQSLRERFPSRYRELVEQYYRTLAEDK